MKKLLTIFLFVHCFNSFAQLNDSTAWRPFVNEHQGMGMVMGIHQFSNTFLELGLSYTKSKVARCIWSSYYRGSSFSIQYNPFKQVTGLTLTQWTNLASFITTGVSASTYTDFTHYQPEIKPFIGIGPGAVCLTYGYAFGFIQSELEHRNKHCFSLRVNIDL